MKHITIKDIAKELGISISTVSRGLAGDPKVKQHTRDLIVATATRLGYRRNLLAANLRSNKPSAIGVILRDMHVPFASVFIKGVQEIFFPKEIKVIVADSQRSSQTELQNIELMESLAVDGLIASVCDTKENRNSYIDLENQRIPLVYVGSRPDFSTSSLIITNDYKNAGALTDHLISSGRKQIVHIGGPQNIYCFSERNRGYYDSISKAKLEVPGNLSINNKSSVADGAEAVDRLIASEIGFDAIFAATDILAIGAMNRLRQLGFRVPEDVAIAGFSGSPLSTMTYPPLSTAEYPLEEIGRTAARLLLQKLENPDSLPETIEFDARIHLRGSSLIP